MTISKIFVVDPCQLLFTKTFVPLLGVGHLIKKIVHSQYMSTFSSHWRIINIDKIHMGIIKKLLISKNVHPISSDKLN